MAQDAEESARRLAEQHGLRFVDLTQSALAPGAASLLTEAMARRNHAVPIGRRLGTPVIAVADPGDLFAMDSLRQCVGREFVAVVARPEQVERAIRQLYRPMDPEPEEELLTADGSSEDASSASESRVESVLEPSNAAIAVADEMEGEGGRSGSEVRAGSQDAGDRDTSSSAAKTGAETEGEEGGLTSLQLEPLLLGDDAAGHNGHKGNGKSTGGGGESRNRGKGRALSAPGEGRADTGTAVADRDEEGYDKERVADGDEEAYVGEAVPEGTDVMAEVSPELEALAETLAPVTGPGEETDEVPPDVVLGSLEESLRDFLSPPTQELVDVPADVDGAAAGDLETAPTFAPAPTDYASVEVSEDDDAIAHGPPLARVLVESGKVTPEEMAAALRDHRASGESLALYLFNRHMATEDDLVRAMAQEVGLEFVDLSTFPINAVATELIPEAVARHHMVLPIAITDGVPVVAMANPTDVFAMDDLRTIMGRSFTPVVATESQIAMHLRYVRSADAEVEDIAEDAAVGIAGGTASGFELETLTAVVEDAPIVRYVNLLILHALNERASDIHIDPSPKALRIRFRIDGVMHDATSASPTIQQAVISRLKVLGEMDITEHRVPQEGRVSLKVSERQIDLRLAILPSMYGETCVMRLLDKSANIRSLPDLGFAPLTLERFSRAYRHPYGVILVTGPTGAGKTTTLYATLQEVLTPEKSVVTVEDPVEYQIDSITQVQINKKAGLQFATALRSILRADPDVVLIGEIRDADTATIAMEAALSGHLVLSTLHTNSAAATPLRLTEMGIEPFLVTSSLSTVLTQRLTRVLCDQCKQPFDASESDFIASGYKESDLEGIELSTLYKPVGCRHCSSTGYLGRMVLAEVMTVSEEIERMIIDQASIEDIERKSVELGMITLRMDGLTKALSGVTTLEEVMRVVV